MDRKNRLPRALIAVAAVAGLAVASGAAAQDAENPCAKYAAKLCEKADPASCESVKTALRLMPPAACEAGLNEIEYSFDKISEMAEKCTELGERLCGDLGEDTQTCKLVRTKVPQMAPTQCAQMMDQYAQVLADLKRQEAANQPLSEEDQKAVATGTNAVFGPADAEVTVVEFSDFQCPYCSRAASVAHQIKEKYPDQVRFVFRQFPLSFHEDAHLAAQAALAAGAQGKFWEYHDLLFENQKQLERESLEQYAEQLDLDMEQFEAALDEGKYEEVVDADIALGSRVAVSGTPTMFVNGKRVRNATDFASVSAQIDQELKSGE